MERVRICILLLLVIEINQTIVNTTKIDPTIKILPLPKPIIFCVTRTPANPIVYTLPLY